MSTLLKIYLSSMVFFPWFSVILYLLFPGETMKYFGHSPTPSGEFWVQVVASGDVLIGFLALVGLRTRNNEVLNLVLQSIAIYSLFHMSTFCYDHIYRRKHPNGLTSYVAFLSMSILACMWWTRWKISSPLDDTMVEEEPLNGNSFIQKVK